MPIEYTIILSIVTAGIALVGVATGRNTLRRAQQRDDKEEGAQFAKVEESLDRIDKGIAEIKYDMRTIKDEIKETRERVIKVEESTKQAHKRLDELSGRK